MMRYQVPQSILDETFALFRRCGAGRRECELLWVSLWSNPERITAVVHPRHQATFAGVRIDPDWIADYWLELSRTKMGIRVQVHTHPGVAFHSGTDDEFPLIHQPGFLSLVIPNFAFGDIGFQGARLATRPLPSGSGAAGNTMGMTEVACFAATTAAPEVTMTSTLSRTNSAASSHSRCRRPKLAATPTVSVANASTSRHRHQRRRRTAQLRRQIGDDGTDGSVRNRGGTRSDAVR
jgi:hypothetical protein